MRSLLSRKERMISVSHGRRRRRKTCPECYCFRFHPAGGTCAEKKHRKDIPSQDISHRTRCSRTAASTRRTGMNGPVYKDVPGQVGPDLFDAIFFLHATVPAVIPVLLFLAIPVKGHVVEVFHVDNRFLFQVCLQ